MTRTANTRKLLAKAANASTLINMSCHNFHNANGCVMKKLNSTDVIYVESLHKDQCPSLYQDGF